MNEQFPPPPGIHDFALLQSVAQKTTMDSHAIITPLLSEEKQFIDDIIDELIDFVIDEKEIEIHQLERKKLLNDVYGDNLGYVAPTTWPPQKTTFQ